MAIAFDSGTFVASTTGTSLTFSHTTTGNQRLLIVGGHDSQGGSSTITGITYGGVALTKEEEVQVPGDRWMTLWYLVGPASGANNVVVTSSGSENLRFSALSYTGVDQSTPAGPTDGSDTATTTAPNSEISTTITTTADNDWMVMFAKDDGGANTFSSSTGDTMRLATDAGGQAWADTGAPISPAGSTTMTLDNGNMTDDMGAIGLAFKVSSITGIEFDAISTGGNGGTSQTFSHTCSGTNRLLFVGGFNQEASSTITGVTYDGVALAEIDNSSQTNNSVSLWYLIAPSTGANDVVITRSTSTNALLGVAVSYTGCLQSGVPDSDNTGGASSGSSLTIGTTTVEENCWIVGIFRNEVAVNSAGSNTTMRNSSSVSMGDTNGSQSPAGLHSIGTTWSGSGRNVGVVASFQPARATSTAKVLAVAGGGGGGTGGAGCGGGGAGGYQYANSYTVAIQSYSVTVGTGGAGGAGGSYNAGANGTNSVFGSITATGGGGGATEEGNGGNGGSGGGTSYHTNGSPGTGIGGQGYDGGDSTIVASFYCGAGGGGASEVGEDNTAGTAGGGGNGKANTLTASSVSYSGGGGGSGRTGATGGAGGTGGGGDGGLSTESAGDNGTVNTGGGGGAACGDTLDGGDGGSGIVIVAYKTTEFNHTGGDDTGTNGDDTWVKFTSDGTLTLLSTTAAVVRNLMTLGVGK
jgi:hypothetical protein